MSAAALSVAFLLLSVAMSPLALCGGTGEKATSPSIAEGQRIVRASCETCHSLTVDKVRVGPSLFGALNGPHPRLTSEQAKTILRNGRDKMPSYRSVFSEAQIDSIVAYLQQIS